MGTKALIGVGALAAALLTYVLIADDDRSEAPLEDTASIESDDAAPTAAHVEGTAAPELQGREGAPSDPSQGTPATTTKAAPTRTVPAGRRAVPGRIGGQIVNSRGERIDAQVQVEILKDGVRAAYPGSTTPLTTDEAGWFSLDRLPKGFYVLTIRAEGYIGISPPVQAGDPPQVYELQSAHPIAGTVVDKASGEPVAGLYVMARSTKSVAAGTNHMAVSAEDGSFRIENLPEGEYALTVGPPHRLYASSPWTTQDLGVVKGGTEDVQAEAVRGLAIAGVIRDADGSPCSKAINVEALGQTQHGDPDYSRRRRVTSGKGGTFRIDGLPEGSYDLTFEPAAAEGEGAASIAATARKGIRAGSEDLVVDLSAGESMVGKVIDEEGNAVTSTGLLYIHPAGSVTGSQGTVIVRVDRTGTFRSPPFDSAMSYRILATSFPGYMQATAEGVRAGPTEITITLTAAGSIRGRLVDAEGKPVPRGVGVVAVATDAEPGAKGTSSVAYAGAGGAFELTGLGPYSFALRGGGGQSAYRALGEAITAKPGATEVVVKVQLGVEFSGRLLDAEGEPLKTHHLAAYQAGGRAALLPTTSVGTDDGSFTLRGLRKGKLTLRAQIGGSMVELGEFEAPGKDVEVRLPKEP